MIYKRHVVYIIRHMLEYALLHFLYQEHINARRYTILDLANRSITIRISLSGNIFFVSG